jgi:hypothetical protein
MPLKKIMLLCLLSLYLNNKGYSQVMINIYWSDTLSCDSSHVPVYIDVHQMYCGNAMGSEVYIDSVTGWPYPAQLDTGMHHISILVTDYRNPTHSFTYFRKIDIHCRKGLADPPPHLQHLVLPEAEDAFSNEQHVLFPEAVVAFPNPSTGALTIRFQRAGAKSIYLFDYQNRPVPLEVPDLSGQQIIELNPGQLIPGIYFLMVKYEDNTIIKRIIRQ